MFSGCLNGRQQHFVESKPMTDKNSDNSQNGLKLKGGVKYDSSYTSKVLGNKNISFGKTSMCCSGPKRQERSVPGHCHLEH